MKNRIFDFIVTGMVFIFAIDMIADKAFATPTKKFDELDLLIAKSEKTMAKSATVVRAAAKKQQQVQEDIISNVESLEKTITETKNALEDSKREMEFLKEATAQITEEIKKDSNLLKQVMTSGLDAVVNSRVQRKSIEYSINKALEERNEVLADSLIREALEYLDRESLEYLDNL